MKTQTIRNQTLAFCLSLGALTGLSCTRAEAMAPARVLATPAQGTQDGTAQDGYALGLTNGGNTVTRLQKRTTDVDGCAAVGKLERALITVTKAIRPPTTLGSDAVVAGFYQGYLDAIRQALQNVRAGCGETAYEDGATAAGLLGAVVCQTATVNGDALLDLKLQPLYAGWSGGSDAIQASCLATVQATVEQCTGADIGTTLEVQLAAGCGDSQAS